MQHRRFWMIVMDPGVATRTGVPDPRKVYTKREQAMQDIESLVKKEGRRYYLLEAVASAVPATAPVVWTGDEVAPARRRSPSRSKADPYPGAVG